MEILVFLISFVASVVGAICGIGGGVIIKPLTDSLGIFSVATISFLSGCTVLAMATLSVASNHIKGNREFSLKLGLPLAGGAAIGGVLGKWLFEVIKNQFNNQDTVGAVQAACLLIVTALTLLYTIFKARIHTKNVTNVAACLGIGLSLGGISAFLGIGGGPINLVVLYFFFSMETKLAAQTSLFIIFFSQLASLIASIAGRSVPEFKLHFLIIMILGGFLGGTVGHFINRRISEKNVEKLFEMLMGVMIIINIINIYKFIGI